MQKFRKKPVVIEAWQWTDQPCEDWPDYIRFYKLGRHVVAYSDDSTLSIPRLVIPTLEGEHIASRGDWIIKGIRGELYPIKNEIFLATYDSVEGDPRS